MPTPPGTDVPNEGADATDQPYSLQESVFADTPAAPASMSDGSPQPSVPELPSATAELPTTDTLADILPPASAAPITPVTPPVTPTAVAKFPSAKDRWDRSVAKFKGNLGTYIAISCATIVLILLGGGLSFLATSLSMTVVVSILSSILTYALASAFPYMVAAAAGGDRFGGAFKKGLRNIVPNILTGLLLACICMLPALLIVPAIIMSLRFALVVNVMVHEKLWGIKALARSRQLVFGRTVTLLFDSIGLSVRFLLINILIFAVSFAISLGFPQNARQTVQGVLSSLCLLLIVPLFLIYMQTFYEDCVAVVGKEVAPDPKLIRLYRILAALGFVALVAAFVGPLFFAMKNFATGGNNPAGGNDQLINDNGTDGGDTQNGTSGDAVATPSARDMQRIKDMNAMRNALAVYFRENKNYPEDPKALVPKYLPALLPDPSSPDQEYVYSKGELTYRISFSLERGALVYAAGKHVLTPQGFDVEALPTPVPPDEVTNSTNVTPPGEATPAPVTSQADTDGDKLANADETSMGTDPAKSDTDGDRFSDGYEVYVTKTDPKKADTDGDGFDDYSEVQNGYEPTVAGAPLTPERRTQIESDRARFDAR